MKDKSSPLLTAVIKNHEIQSAEHRLTLNLTIHSSKLQGVEPYSYLYNEIEQFLKEQGYYPDFEKQVAAGTATLYKEIQLKRNGLVKIDNETEGYQINGPARISIFKKIN